MCFYFPVPAFGRAGDITTTHSVLCGNCTEYILVLTLTDECKYNYRCIACLLEARLAPRWHGSSMAQRVFSVWGSAITSLGYPYALLSEIRILQKYHFYKRFFIKSTSYLS